MNTSTLVMIVSAVLGVASLGIFIYCCWLDRNDNGAGKNKH